MTRGGSPAGSLSKKHNVLSPKVTENIDRKASKIQMGEDHLFREFLRDRVFVLIDSGMPGDRDALYFLREINPFFPFIGNIVWLKCTCTYT
jgi:hypothetical protein